MFVRLALAWLAANCVSGAYVQWQSCDGPATETDVFVPESVSATLMPSDDGRENLLTLRAFRLMEEAECRELSRMVHAAWIQIEMLGRSSAYRTATNATCNKFDISNHWVSPLGHPARLYVSVSSDVGPLPPSSTFHITFHLEGTDSEEISCQQANITPALSATISYAITYSTWALFIFVLLVGIACSFYSTPVTLDDDDDEPRPVQTLLPNVGDCLQYLQFIFLTGGLSLRYPGFYQPVVSHLSWWSLFGNGPITHGRMYDSVEDGIYVVNGTYGGTYGLELMTQIAGAPMSMDTWLNMVVLLFIIAAGVALVLKVSWLVNRNRGPDSRPSQSGGGIRQDCNRTLRVILSYFMFPLVALSFYQLDQAEWLPIYHTSLAAMLIVAMMAAFIWLIRQIPTRNLGALLFDSTKRYRQLPPSQDFRRQDDRFIFIIFALTFVRGAAVGGLQISGASQLAVLGACELILLASIAGFQAYSTFSVGSIAAAIRLCSLVFLIAFLPGIATTGIKSAIGFLLLSIHAGMLVLGFLVPAACDLGNIIKTWWTAPKPDVYGLRELRRRDVSPSNLSSMYTTNEFDTSDPEPDDVGEPNTGYLRPTYRPDSPSTMHLSPSAASSRYFRPPRSSASISSVDHPRTLGSSLHSPSRTVSTSTSTSIADKHFMQHSPSMVSPNRLSESIGEEEASTTSGTSSTRVDSGPLGPRWNDYSFREADLYYGTPRPLPAERASEDLPRPSVLRPSFRSSSGFWAKVTGQAGASEQGFQVSRPRPRPEVGFVVVRPDRPNNLGNGPGSGAARSPSQGA
ncbi:hypothetical protein LZ31DRAFT_596106 [Colletotrichum somersetense]|nr:hypothetical protein LZ31DRAFT_596106 [Colletotrichum somersetense]